MKIGTKLSEKFVDMKLYWKKGKEKIEVKALEMQGNILTKSEEV